MQLLIYITKQLEKLPAVLSGFMEEGVRGATVVDSQGALQTILADSEEAPPIFGSLRKFLNPGGEEEKMVFVVLPEDKVETAKSVIRRTVDLSRPDTGIFFTLPVNDVEGLAKE
ncbi:MAG: hypothetical protein J6Z79_01020 [Clostridia bacterium]|nr:hypothetical protein [Clostridia bacterium]